jgi:hypothetical protein
MTPKSLIEFVIVEKTKLQPGKNEHYNKIEKQNIYKVSRWENKIHRTKIGHQNK